MNDLNMAAKLASENDLKSIYTAPTDLDRNDNVYWGGELMGQVVTKIHSPGFLATSVDGEDMIAGDSYPTYESAAQVAAGMSTDVNVVRVQH